MMASKVQIYLCFQIFLLEYTGAQTYSCKCSTPPHPQGDYCHSNFAIRGIVQDIRFGHKDEDDPSSWNQPDVYHTIRIKEDFKNIPEDLLDWYGNDRSITLETYMNTYSSCGADLLDVGEQYLLTGEIFDGRFSMNLCHTHEIWDFVDDELKQKWKQGFECDDCKVRSDQDSNHVCILDEDDAWLYEKSDCLRNDKNICDWT